MLEPFGRVFFASKRLDESHIHKGLFSDGPQPFHDSPFPSHKRTHVLSLIPLYIETYWDVEKREEKLQSTQIKTNEEAAEELSFGK